MATKLGLYNGALREIEERKLSDITEAREPRRVLDDAYTNFVDYVLSQGFWKCSLRTSKISYDTNVTPEFGYLKAYSKPDDIVKTYKIASDEFLNCPLIQYSEEGAWWYGHINDIYVQYVSNSTSYGADLSLWTPLMARYGELLLASWIVARLNPKIPVESLEAKAKRALNDALAKDAMEGPPVFMPNGTWLNSRGPRGGRTGRDRGNRSSLIG